MKIRNATVVDGKLVLEGDPPPDGDVRLLILNPDEDGYLRLDRSDVLLLHSHGLTAGDWRELRESFDGKVRFVRQPKPEA